jgi:uncharacterized FlaG/YvyC family protein
VGEFDRIRRSDGVFGSRGLDKELPERERQQQEREDPPDDLRWAVAELKAAAKEFEVKMDFHLDQELGLIRVTVEEGGSRRILREIEAEEALRLARQIRSGQRRLMDRTA